MAPEANKSGGWLGLTQHDPEEATLTSQERPRKNPSATRNRPTADVDSFLLRGSHQLTLSRAAGRSSVRVSSALSHEPRDRVLDIRERLERFDVSSRGQPCQTGESTRSGTLAVGVRAQVRQDFGEHSRLADSRPNPLGPAAAPSAPLRVEVGTRIDSGAPPLRRKPMHRMNSSERVIDCVLPFRHGVFRSSPIRPGELC